MYKRIILKLSGETLAPDASKPDAPRGVFDAQRVDAAAEMILKLQARGIQVGVVIGGRQHLARPLHKGNERRERRSDGHARHDHQRAVRAGRDHPQGRQGRGVLRAGNEPLHASVYPLRRAGRDERRLRRTSVRRHRQPLLHHRHRRRAARRRAGRGRDLQGHHGRGRVRFRPAQEPGTRSS